RLPSALTCKAGRGFGCATSARSSVESAMMVLGLQRRRGMPLAYAGGRGRVQCAIGLVFTALAMLAPSVSAQTAAAKAAAAKPQRTVLVMGDSLSAAYGLSASQGWVALTADRVTRARPGWRVV